MRDRLARVVFPISGRCADGGRADKTLTVHVLDDKVDAIFPRVRHVEHKECDDRIELIGTDRSAAADADTAAADAADAAAASIVCQALVTGSSDTHNRQ